jgi:hypothetical protein
MQFGDWSTDAREINFYTSLCAMPTEKIATEYRLYFSFILPAFHL